MFALFELIILALLYFVSYAVYQIAKKTYMLELFAYMLRKFNIIFYLGDIFYAVGIGVSGNGFYEFLTKGNFETLAISYGLCAIIIGAILRSRT